MGDISYVLCEGCEFKSLATKAKVWCYDCQGGLCDDCLKGHETTKSLRSHHVITIQDHYSMKNDSIETVCSEHDKKLEKFCLTHDEMLCVKCIQKEHCNCQDLLEIDEAAKGVKISPAMANLEALSNVIIKNIDKVSEIRKEDLEQLKEQKSKIEQQIIDERSKINSHLDNLQSELMEKLQSRIDSAKTDIDFSERYLTVMKQGISQLQAQIARLKMHAPEKKTFIGIKNAERYLIKEKIKLKREIDNMVSHTLECEFGSSLKSLLNNFYYTCMGQINLRKMAIDASFEELIVQAQGTCASIVMVNTISNIELAEKTVLEVETGDIEVSLRDGVSFENGEFVFADYTNNRLIHLDENGNRNRETTIEFQPEHMCFVKDETVLVGGRIGCNLLLVDDDSLKEVNKRRLTSYLGLSFEDDRIYRARVRENDIAELNMDGDDKKFISVVEKVCKIAVQGGLIYYTAFQSKTLYCCNKLGITMWSVSHDVIKTAEHSASITLDEHNNVFVLGSGLLVVSPGGKHYKVLLKSSELKDLTEEPSSGLFYDKHRDQLLLTFANFPKAILYDVEK